MSLRVIVKSDQIRTWIEERCGTPVRRRNTDADLAVLFGGNSADYEPVSINELLETMRFHHLVLLVDQEAGKTFHKFVQHG
ncbi:MAG TPA: hypothetical protein VMV72_10235 [Verrucomicrobiae bacterium]|nr:hypothetical protein [Verrucomicrobiae bacterium]